MKAAVFREYNKDSTKVVKIEDIDMPKLKSSEVMLKVEAAAYNYNDLWAIWGDPVKVPLPHVSGSDVAGTVVEVGEDVSKFKVGERVVSHSNLSCRVCEACTSGREYDCNDRTIWGFQTGPLWGGFAQYTHLPEVNVAKIPENVSYQDFDGWYDCMAYVSGPGRNKAWSDSIDNGRHKRSWHGRNPDRQIIQLYRHCNSRQ
jgi:alcohol dehydrogenase